MISPEQQARLIRIAEERKIYLIFDETYRHLAFGEPLPAAASLSPYAIQHHQHVQVATACPASASAGSRAAPGEIHDGVLAVREQVTITNGGAQRSHRHPRAREEGRVPRPRPGPRRAQPGDRGGLARRPLRTRVGQATGRGRRVAPPPRGPGRRSRRPCTTDHRRRPAGVHHPRPLLRHGTTGSSASASAGRPTS
jgi:hypothetical protein